MCYQRNDCYIFSNFSFTKYSPRNLGDANVRDVVLRMTYLHLQKLQVNGSMKRHYACENPYPI